MAFIPTPQPQANHEKTIRQTQTEVQSTGPVLLRAVRVIRNKESLRNREVQKKLKRNDDYNMESWVDLGAEKVHQGRTNET